VEDAALGVAVSAIVGLLLWPRGAQGQLRSALADLYDAAASSLSFSFRRMLTDASEPGEEVSSSHRLARTEAIRAQEVFEQFLTERTHQAPGVEVWAVLLSTGKGFLLIGDVLDWLVEHGYAASQAGAPAGTLATVAGSAVAHIVRLAEELRSGHRLRVAGPPDTSAKLRTAALASLSEPALSRSPAVLRSAIGLVSAADWLQQLEMLLLELEAPVAATLSMNSTPWWR